MGTQVREIKISIAVFYKNRPVVLSQLGSKHPLVRNSKGTPQKCQLLALTHFLDGVEEKRKENCFFVPRNSEIPTYQNVEMSGFKIL